MKFLIIFYISLSCFVGKHLMKDLKCETEGCYEVIKVFADLLEEKINASDAILAEAEKELSEITLGNDESFKAKIKEVDEKLATLIAEINAGVDGGEKTLIELINSVFDDVREIEYTTEEIENLAENADKNAESIDKNVDKTQELIREIQDEINRLQNATTQDGPEALQNAFDRSKKFDTDSSELKETLGQVKLILKDYEENLMNAKKLTSLAIEKFAKVSEQEKETMEANKEVDEKLKGPEVGKLSEDELEGIKKIVKQALENANEDAFDLLNEVSELELNDKLEEINKKVKTLNDISDVTKLNLTKFSEENANFLDDMEKTIDMAEKLEAKAFELEGGITALLEMIQVVYDDAKKAILAVESSVINDARNILVTLQDFSMKVEESKENARRALEKIPEILKKINESVAIVGKLEENLDEQTKAATDAKEKCATAKTQMDEILKETEEIKEKMEQLKKDFGPLPDEHDNLSKSVDKTSDDIEQLETDEVEDEVLIELTKIKVGKAKAKNVEIDQNVEETLKTIEDLLDQINKVKTIDEGSLKDFEDKLKEAEKELEDSQLEKKLLKLRATRHDQQEQIDRYRIEIAALEYQVSVLKNNAESLETRCFKRTRLEP